MNNIIQPAWVVMPSPPHPPAPLPQPQPPTHHQQPPPTPHLPPPAPTQSNHLAYTRYRPAHPTPRKLENILNS